MENHQINVRVRLIIIKNGKLLTTFNQQKDYYYYIGGHLEYGETILDCAVRELKEECGSDTEFTFKKILYIRDHLLTLAKNGQDEHSVELFILGDINKFSELEKHLDPEHLDGTVYSTWLELNNLPQNLLPRHLTQVLLKDYQANFPNSGVYLGAVQ
jgi:ADP-ribose pyrophosphatase YjhB (NUDIX family)